MRAVHLATAAMVALAGCERSSGPSEKRESAAQLGGRVDLEGAGATFPYPLYSKWIAEYQKVEPRVQINYQSIGSGGGIRQILERTVDFGASDAPMTDAELSKASAKLVHIPMTLGAVVIAYNVPGVAKLRLSPDVIAGIFLGEIKTWNDPKIAATNPGVKLPADPVLVAYRSDGSGTTAVFTEYLSRVSPEWKERVGNGKSVKFPVGMGAKGNEGVAGQIKTSPGTVGYVELAYAKQTGLPSAAIRNRAGKFLDATLAGITAAAASVAGGEGVARDRLPEDLRVSIVDASRESAYPISAFTYILVYEEQPDAAKGRALAQFLWWAIHEGQRFGPALDYAPLPPEIVKKDEAKLRELRAGGQALLAAGT